MKKVPKSVIVLLIGVASVVVSVLVQNPFLLYGGLLTALISGIISVSNLLKRRFGQKNRTYYPSFWAIVSIGYIVFVATSVCVIGFINEWDFRFEHIIGLIILNMVLSVLYTYVYFLPYLLANKKQHPQTRAIYVLNIFAGWTILAWIIALIWSSTEQKEKVVVQQTVQNSAADELKKYKNLLDGGVITQEEFDAKKKQLLENCN